ncbi:LPS assembly lipoprotein LptE [Algirhabdus cladophorae]|uniref:LPS assembly lipoprotein LptE n=1 Tax=Algirhabdus cladophorae TaxID=3377108 RepID=UPI003B849D9C
MSLLNRRLILLGGLATAGCQFAPVYSDRNDLWGAFAFTAPKNRLGFVLKQRLEDRMGQPQSPRYDVALSLSNSLQRNAITADGTTTRFKVFGTVSYTLKPFQTKTVLHNGTVNSFTSYSNTGTTVANTTARQDASDRLMSLLADQLVARLYALGPSLT